MNRPRVRDRMMQSEQQHVPHRSLTNQPGAEERSPGEVEWLLRFVANHAVETVFNRHSFYPEAAEFPCEDLLLQFALNHGEDGAQAFMTIGQEFQRADQFIRIDRTIHL